MRDRLGKGTAEAMKLPEQFVWRDVNGAGVSAMTRAVGLPTKSGDGLTRHLFGV